MGVATLGYPQGPAISFRIDPNNIEWDYQIITNVIETVGGRVVQIIGSYLNNMTVQGDFGQDHSTRYGESWRQAEQFLGLITQIMEAQSADANQQELMAPPAVFSYPPKGWYFQVYVDSMTDPRTGNSVMLTPGTFNNQYQLSLFIVSSQSQGLVTAGTIDGVLNQQAEAAINAYMARISEGIGWSSSVYTGTAVAGAVPKTSPAPSSPTTRSGQQQATLPGIGAITVNPITGQIISVG